MFERLDQIEARYEELTNALASPDIVNDSAKYQKTAKAHSEVAPVVDKYREYKDLTRGIAESKAMLAEEKDPEMRAYAQEELARLEPRVNAIEEELKVLLLPKDPNDEKNVILEIRAGTGGDEATLFAAEIFRMYTRFAETQRWKVEILSSSDSSAGGLKEVIAIIEGNRVFSQLKYESGVHRVQRVPATEQQGRCAARSRGCRYQDRGQRSPHRYFLLFGAGRTIGKHNILRGSNYAHSNEYSGQLPGREIADQESREGHARAPIPALRDRDG